MSFDRKKVNFYVAALCVLLFSCIAFLAYGDRILNHKDDNQRADFGELSHDEARAESSPVKGRVSGLPVPRFISTKAKRGYLREGPSKDHKILFEYQKIGVPLEVLDEFDIWLYVRDVDNAKGWIHKSVVSGKRYAVVVAQNVILREQPDETASSVTRAQKNIVFRLSECRADWCFISVQSVYGWVKKTDLFGVYDRETGKMM